MTNSWEAARASLGSLSGSSSSAQSNPHQQQQQQPQQQPAKHKQQKYLATPGPAMVPAAPSGSGAYNYFDTPVNANAIVSERTNSLHRLRRAGYANRSFMHHGEYLHHHPAELDDGYGDDFPGGGGGGGRLPYFVEPTYRSLEYDRRQRRRHSVHQLASLNVAQLEDARHRFDDYNNQSAAIAKGAYYGYYTLDRSKKLSRQLAANQAHHGAMAYGKPSTFGQTLGGRYSGSRTLERVVVEDERGQHRKGPKRGSRSSQGSTDSNNSTHSASSGSLLLTVANLENFAKIHRKPVSSAGGNSKLPGAGSSRTLERYLSSTLELVPHHGTLGRRSRYNSNILLPHEAIEADEYDDDAAADGVHPADRAAIDYRKDVQLQQQLQLANSTIVPIDEISIDEGDEEASGNGSEQQLAGSGPGAGGGGTAPSLVSPFRSLKGKDPDSVSMASSTHFTMVNGIGGPQRVMKSGICSSGHQITILIVTMSIIFMIGICSAVFLLEKII
ncbi:hypothetical protein ZHAS_00009900 [Anopheles sinensis]|uniref:Uncharacterized protein n=1 Tax=Anopheles sinensis TaxID=74873 RepID=A0A084VW55_ANOSI|nr:hypothetical protein ZHAS_00009900 [Anopheles sinensis]